MNVRVRWIADAARTKAVTTLRRLRVSYRAHPRSWLTGVAAASGVVLTAALAIALRPTTRHPTTPPLPRQYIEYTACLLTGARGLSDPDAAPVWAGLQDASLATHAKVQYLQVTGPQTIDNAQTYLNSLIVSGCNLIYAAGELPTSTIDKFAPSHPDDQFLPVANLQPRPNLTPLHPGTPDQVRAEVRDSMTRAVASGSRP